MNKITKMSVSQNRKGIFEVTVTRQDESFRYYRPVSQHIISKISLYTWKHDSKVTVHLTPYISLWFSVE